MFTSILNKADGLHVESTVGFVAPLIPAPTLKDSALWSTFEPLHAGMEQLVKTLIQDSSDLNEEGYLKKTKDRTRQYVKYPFNSGRKAVVDEKVSRRDREVRLMSTTGYDKAMFPEYRADLLRRPPMERATVLLKTEKAALVAAAIDAGPDMMQIDPAVWSRIEAHFSVLNHVSGPGSSRFVPAAATLSDLTPAEPDWTAIRKDAEAKFADLQNAQDAIEAADQYLAGVIPFIAESCAGLSSKEVFDLLVAS